MRRCARTPSHICARSPRGTPHQRETLWRTEPRLRAETFLLAPEVGLKGRLDFLMSDELGGSLLELKTGEVRSQPPKREHRWQVYGYHTLLAARRRARKGPRAGDAAL